MQRLALLALILIAGCVSAPLETNTRPALEAHVELSNNKTTDSSRVIFIVSDYEKAARTSLEVTESVYLPTQPPVNITVLEADEQTALFEVNKQQERINRGESILFEQGAIRIQLAE